MVAPPILLCNLGFPVCKLRWVSQRHWKWGTWSVQSVICLHLFQGWNDCRMRRKIMAVLSWRLRILHTTLWTLHTLLLILTGWLICVATMWWTIRAWFWWPSRKHWRRGTNPGRLNTEVGTEQSIATLRLCVPSRWIRGLSLCTGLQGTALNPCSSLQSPSLVFWFTLSINSQLDQS